MNKDFFDYSSKLYSFCPYLKKSVEKNLLKSTDLVLNSNLDDERLSEEIFYNALVETEKFRLLRSTLSKEDLIYYSSNLIIDIDTKENRNWEKIISWPHYILKVLYSKEQIMFGKFWKGEDNISNITSKKIPIPELTFISIRTAVKERDSKLLFKYSEFRDVIKNSEITDRNVNLEFISNSEILLNVDKLRETGYYSHLKSKLLKKLKDR